MELGSYAQFSSKLHLQVLEQRIPAGGSIEITQRCNLNCAHCYTNLPFAEESARDKELSTEEHCRILDEITDAGCLWLLFTGGEIFARPDFMDIYLYAKQKGLIITLFTNGTLVTPQIADALAQWPPFSIEITLYGKTKETYERITGVAGSFDKCQRGIALLKERGLPLTLKTMVMTLNHAELLLLKHYVEEDLQLPFKFDAMINPRTDCALTPLSVRLKPEDIVQLDQADARRMEEWKVFADRFVRPVPSQLNSKLYQCGGGVTSFAIDPYGVLRLCLMASGEGYDLRSGSFIEGWNTHLFDLRQVEITKQTACVGCELKSLCGMCPVNGQLENQDPEEPVDFLCRVAHLRAKALGLPLSPRGTGGEGVGGLSQPKSCPPCEEGCSLDTDKPQKSPLLNSRCGHS